jgi:hypothetical protein
MLQNTDLAGGRKVVDARVYSFKQGIGALSDGLVTVLQSNPKVQLKKGMKVENIAFDGETNNVKVGT